jgi:hypothetical protein
MSMDAWRVSAAVVALLMTMSPGGLWSEQIDACFNPRSGNLRLLTATLPHCLGPELPISWNAQEVSPPIIDRTLTCENSLEVVVGLTIWDDAEVAFFAIQKQGTDPALNYVYSVEPGVQSVDYEILIGVGSSEESYLVLASDVEGNVSKDLFSVPPGFCLDP